MTIESDFSAWWGTFEAQAEAKIASFEAGAEVVLEQLGKSAETYLELGMEKIGTFAMNAVLAQGVAVATGQEKFGAALTTVVQNVEAEGKTIAMQTAGMFVQAAFTTLQTAATKAVAAKAGA